MWNYLLKCNKYLLRYFANKTPNIYITQQLIWLKSAMKIWHNPVTNINGQDTANVIWALLMYMSSFFILLFCDTLNPLFASLYNLLLCWRFQDEGMASKTATTSVNPSACIHSLSKTSICHGGACLPQLLLRGTLVWIFFKPQLIPESIWKMRLFIWSLTESYQEPGQPSW